MSKKNQSASAPGEKAAGADVKKSPANMKQRAVSVIKGMKLDGHIAQAVLVEMGLKPTAMVDPSEFKKKVTAWLNAPANK